MNNCVRFIVLIQCKTLTEYITIVFDNEKYSIHEYREKN
jgi:hypothetical protein